jgi:hypothetical protein
MRSAQASTIFQHLSRTPFHFFCNEDQHLSIGLYLLWYGRIVDQVDLQAGPIGEFDHPLEKLGADSRVLGAIIQIDNQSPDFAELASHPGPPYTQAVTPKVARFVIAKQQSQRPGRENQNAKGNQLFLCRRIVVPAFGDAAFTVGSRFPLPTRIHPNRLLSWYPRRFPASLDRLRTARERHVRSQRSCRCLLSS